MGAVVGNVVATGALVVADRGVASVDPPHATRSSDSARGIRRCR